MAADKYLNILHSRKVAEIATRNGRMRDVGNKECITEERERERGQTANSGSSLRPYRPREVREKNILRRNPLIYP